MKTATVELNQQTGIMDVITMEKKDDHVIRRQRQYGSIETVPTEVNTLSCSSSSSYTEESTALQPISPVRTLNLSLFITNSEGEGGFMSCTPCSRVSSCSDVSEEGKYYDQTTPSESACNNSCRKSLFTMNENNYKLILSISIWFISYMIMGLFGGSVAYMHFQRSQRDVPDSLPDFGYDIIPYWCPSIPHIPHGNVQSVVLVILYTIILTGVAIRWNPHYCPQSGSSCGGDGRLILQHLCHLNCLVFLTRTSTVGLTGLPQPNPKCVEQQHLPVTYGNAVRFVMGRGFPPRACGDLIYSGHVGCTLICMAVLHRHGFLRNKFASTLAWFMSLIGIYFTISCRSHYSVDVILAFYFGYFLPEWYFHRSDGIVQGPISNWIRRIEVQPREQWQGNYHYDRSHLPNLSDIDV